MLKGGLPRYYNAWTIVHIQFYTFIRASIVYHALLKIARYLEKRLVGFLCYQQLQIIKEIATGFCCMGRNSRGIIAHSTICPQFGSWCLARQISQQRQDKCLQT